MPRKSPFGISLATDGRKQLGIAAHRHTLPHREVMRAKIVLLAADGFSDKEIGQRPELPRQIVSKWRKRFFSGRLAGPEERPRQGRPGVFPP